MTRSKEIMSSSALKLAALSHLISSSLLLILPFEASLAASAGTFFVKSKTDCRFSGNGQVDACATAPGAPGVWRGGLSIEFGESNGKVHDGDTVYFTGNWIGIDAAEGGETYEITARGSGSIGKPIVFDFSRATINCKHQVQRGISIGAFHHYTLREPTIRACGTSSGYGISVDGAVATFDLSVNIESPRIFDTSGTDGGAIAIRGKGANIVVHNPRIDGVSDDGIWIDGDDASTYCDQNDGVTCYIKNVGLGVGLTGDCVQYGATPTVSLNGSIKRVFCDHRSEQEKQCFITNGLGMLTVSDSVCLMPSFDGVTLSNGIYAEGTLTALRNFIDGGRIGICSAMLAGSTGRNNTIVSNIIRGSGFRAISIGAETLASATTDIFHNAIKCGVTRGTSGIYLDGRAGSVINIKNNSLIGCDIAYAGLGQHIVESIAFNNDYLSNTRFKSVANGGNNSTKDPQLVGGATPTSSDDFRPRSGSPLLHTGTCIAELLDFSGNPIRCSPVIGPLDLQ